MKVKEIARKIALGIVLICMTPFVLAVAFLVGDQTPITTTKEDFLDVWKDEILGE